MKIYETFIEIAASESEVWQVLTEVMPADPVPFGIQRIEGDIRAGGRLKLWSEVDPKRAFSLKVAQFDAPRTMVWKGGMPFGLFTGTRTFSLAPSGDGTRLEMREVFNGPLSSMIVKSIP
ncbi:MAG: SRPBCC family protein, partial [Hyphomicrobiales bacterium]|nr:SRPBCC family protein [Hyphomicrobiales bacterium]